MMQQDLFGGWEPDPDACPQHLRGLYSEEQWRACQDRLRPRRVGEIRAITPWALTLGIPWPHYTADDVRRCFRERAKSVHPDAGGSHERFLALVAARDEAIAGLGGA